LFYRVNKCQTLKWTLVAIDRRVDDPAAPTGVQLNPAPINRRVAIIHDAVVATAKDRPDAARRVNEAIAIEQSSVAVGGVGLRRVGVIDVAAQQVLPVDLREAALAQVTAELQKQGLLDERGEVSPEAHTRLDWQRELSLPTPGVVVKACLDDCEACEPELERSIKLDNDRKELENQLLARQIELLDKTQEYRCCPGDADAPPV
jgi:hypothetical protein